MKIKYDSKAMGFMTVFENITRCKLKDFIPGDSILTFIVEENEIAKAIGKNGQNAKMLERVLNKRIKIVEFSPELEQFIRNLIYPLQVNGITKDENGLVVLKGGDVATKSMLIGRNATNLRNTENVVKRHFDIREIKVI